MSLAVVTFTRYQRPQLLDRCCASVRKDLPVGATHHVVHVPGPSEFADARIRALDLAPVVAFVDDDDQVVNSGLSLAWAAFKSADPGVVFTDEALVDEDNIQIGLREGVRTYEELVDSPWRVHHLSLISVKHVSSMVTRARNYGGSVDRWIRALAIASGGALHVPVIGYLWTQHLGMMSRETEMRRSPTKPPSLTRSGDIPAFNLSTNKPYEQHSVHPRGPETTGTDEATGYNPLVRTKRS